MSNLKTWIVVANGSTAKFFRLVKFPKLEVVDTLDHPASRLHDQDLVTERPGRAFDSVGGGRHAYESNPKLHEIEKFGKIVATHLNKAHENGDFNRLYVFSSPSFLGILRQEMNPSLTSAIVQEIDKDMTEHTKEDIEHHLSEV